MLIGLAPGLVVIVPGASVLKFIIIEILNCFYLVLNSYFSFQLEQRDVAASQTLRAALCKAEASHPGVSYDLVRIMYLYMELFRSRR